MSSENKTRLDEEEIRRAIAALRAIHEDRSLLVPLPDALGNELLRLAGQVSRPGTKAKRDLAREVRKQRRRATRKADDELLETTTIRKKRRDSVYQTPAFPPRLPADLVEERKTLHKERNCYVCKKDFRELHFFYDSLCVPCGDKNYAKRTPEADLRGRVAIVTGARVKIGYQAAIMLLRAGAKVIVTTRFPRDAAQRYAQEDDVAEWQGRLEIHGLDLRHTPSVETFCRHMLRSQERLDFIINNACQTVRRPSGFYQHLLDAEAMPLAQLKEAAQDFLRPYESARADGDGSLVRGGHAEEISGAPGWQDPARLSQLALLQEDREGGQALFPAHQLDQDLQQVDMRSLNSWRLPLEQVSSVELLEVQLVNAVAPFVINARLKELMLRVPTRDKHIVNVSAMEGQFYRSFKTDKHPHTNMAKAALNMMTRTSASGYAKDGIFMNSVDTGWVSDEDPKEIAERKRRDHGFHPPLDIVDGAARIVDPIFHGCNTGIHEFGMFFKDYAKASW